MRWWVVHIVQFGVLMPIGAYHIVTSVVHDRLQASRHVYRACNVRDIAPLQCRKTGGAEGWRVGRPELRWCVVHIIQFGKLMPIGAHHDVARVARDRFQACRHV